MGLIVPQTVKVRTNASNYKRYKEKGYTFKKCGDFIEINVLDLSKGSGVKVKVICDICGKESEMWYCTVVKCNEKNELITCGSNSCKNKKYEDTCMKKYGVKNVHQSEEVKNKTKETNLKRYGYICPLQSEEVKKKAKETWKEKYGENVASPLQVESIKNKIKETNLEKYGSENPFGSKEIRNKIKKTWQEKYGENIVSISQVKEIQDKIKATCKERYGVDNPTKSSVIQNKIKATNLEKYGYDWSLQNREVREKIKKTNLERYGSESPFGSKEIQDKIKKTWQENYGENIMYPMQVEEIKNKALDSFQFNSTGPCSRGQKYIHFLIGGVLNKHVCNSLVDICFEEEKIAIEYDGSGHFLTEIFNGNKIPSKEALLKEKKREDKIINNGYRMIRFIATKDRIPSDEVILNLVNEFKNSDFKVVRIDFEKGTIEKDYKEKSRHNFGELRKITQKDLEKFEKQEKNISEN